MMRPTDLLLGATARQVAAYSWRVVSATAKAIDEDRCFDLAAQLAFYLLLALFPSLLVLVALLGYLPIEHAAADLLALIRPVAPAALVDLLAVQLEEITSDGRVGLATVGMAGALWSSSTAMRAIIEALNRAYRVAEWRSWWRRRLVALGLTVACGLFMTSSLLLILLGPQAIEGLAEMLGARDAVATMWQVLRWPAMVALVVIAISMVYHFAPNRSTRWAWITPGSLLATVLWISSSFLFKLYVTHMGTYSVTYGAIGGVIVVLLWLYMSSMAILVGAELNSALDEIATATAPATHRQPGHGTSASGITRH